MKRLKTQKSFNRQTPVEPGVYYIQKNQNSCFLRFAFSEREWPIVSSNN